MCHVPDTLFSTPVRYLGQVPRPVCHIGKLQGRGEHRSSARLMPVIHIWIIGRLDSLIHPSCFSTLHARLHLARMHVVRFSLCQAFVQSSLCLLLHTTTSHLHFPTERISQCLSERPADVQLRPARPPELPRGAAHLPGAAAHSGHRLPHHGLHFGGSLPTGQVGGWLLAPEGWILKV